MKALCIADQSETASHPQVLIQRPCRGVHHLLAALLGPLRVGHEAVKVEVGIKL